MRTQFYLLVAGMLLATGLLTTVTTGARADQFVQVTHPGWTNSSQSSVTGAWGDYDNDGFIDLFVPNLAAGGTGWTNFLYHNNRDGTFTRQLANQVGPIASDKDPSQGGYWGDVNNDGFLDLVVVNLNPSASLPATNRLYLNQGDGTFRSADGGDFTKPSYSGGWGGLADYDNDGWLDAFVIQAFAPSPLTNLLYHGRGDGTFSLVTNCVIVTDRIGSSSSSWANDAAWGDFDNDGKPDLIVANWTPQLSFFYRNDGHGQFTRLTNSILEKHSFLTAAWGDYDNDGFLDLAASARGNNDNNLRLFRNDGSGDFVMATNWPGNYGGLMWGDYDNDGYLDLLAVIVTASARQLRLFHNNGDGTFTQMQDAFTRPSAGWTGGAWGDYDNDGFLDLFVAEGSGNNALYHNLGNTNHWIKFRLEGTVANRTAIGAKVRVKATFGGKTFWQMREVSGGNFCQNDLRPNFGLGDATNVDSVRIEWPGGAVQELHDVAPNQILTVTESARLSMAQPGQLHIQCWKGMAYRIESSPDLCSWTSMATVTNLNLTGGVQWTDPSAPGPSARFYRAVKQ